MKFWNWTLVMFATGCLASAASADKPGSIVAERLAALKVGKAQTYRNLTLYPLLGASYGPKYVTLDEALSPNKAEVLEKGSGEVPKLMFHNKSADRILLVDGEELVGARQNRILDTSILIAPRSLVEIPVSCVEEGRWTSVSPKFKSGGTQLFASARQSNNENVTANYDRNPSDGAVSNQTQIWNQVATKRSQLKVTGASGAMHDAYVQKSGDVESYIHRFEALDGQVGCVLAINGRVVGADIFSSHSAFKKLMPKILKSYALDAISERVSPVKGAADAPEQFLLHARDASMRSMPTVGEGCDVRILSSTISGAGLVAQNAAIHISLFTRPPKAAPASSPGRATPFQRPSQQQRNSR